MNILRSTASPSRPVSSGADCQSMQAIVKRRLPVLCHAEVGAVLRLCGIYQFHIKALSSLARLRLLNVLSCTPRSLNPRRLDIILDLELELKGCSFCNKIFNAHEFVWLIPLINCINMTSEQLPECRVEPPRQIIVHFSMLLI